MMVLEIVLIILGAVCLLGGLIGSLLPVLPGPPLSYGGLLLLHFTERVEFTTTQLIVWFMLVLLTIAFDYLLPIWGVKKWNGSRWGNWGCVAGTLAGVFFFPPWGILIGPFVGAIAGELLLGRRHIRDADQIGRASCRERV